MAEAPEPMAELTPQQVYEVITAAVGLDQTTRRAAEGTLKAWEADAAPGLFGSLIKIVQEGSIDEVRSDTAHRPPRHPCHACTVCTHLFHALC